MRMIYSALFVVALGFPVLMSSGCGSDKDAASQPSSSADPVSDESDHDTVASHDLHGWWCTEHGVPESECALCDTTLVAAFKDKGDWCDEHNRPDSQCFTCDPDKFDTFAARYEAKFGEQPPKPTE